MTKVLPDAFLISLWLSAPRFPRFLQLATGVAFSLSLSRAQLSVGSRCLPLVKCSADDWSAGRLLFVPAALGGRDWRRFQARLSFHCATFSVNEESLGKWRPSLTDHRESYFERCRCCCDALSYVRRVSCATELGRKFSFYRNRGEGGKGAIPRVRYRRRAAQVPRPFARCRPFDPDSSRPGVSRSRTRADLVSATPRIAERPQACSSSSE